jgi:hypothetical protein
VLHSRHRIEGQRSVATEHCAVQIGLDLHRKLRLRSTVSLKEHPMSKVLRGAGMLLGMGPDPMPVEHW